MATVDPMAAQPPMQPSQAAPQQSADDAETDQYENILSALVEFLMGRGRAGIEQQLADGKKDIAQTIGRIAATLIIETVNQAKSSQQQVDSEIMFALAADMIDRLIELAQAMKLKVKANDDLREEAMMSAVQTYLMTANPSPEDQEAAKQLLAQMQQDGYVDGAAEVVREIGQRHGVDPFAQQQPQQNQMAQGIRAGLMGAQ